MAKVLIALLAAWCCAAPAPAGTVGFPRTVHQYTHQRWSGDGEVPAPVTALAQDRRGFLWLATGEGLFRFDGIRFEHISDGVDATLHGTPSAVLVRRNGEVWTSFDRSRRFAVYRNGRLGWLAGPVAPARVSLLQEGPDGSVWAMTDGVEGPLLRYRAGKWSRYWPPPRTPLDNPVSMVVAADGAIWLSLGESVVRLDPSGGGLRTVRQTPRALGAMSLDPSGRIWITERRGTYPITGPGGKGSPPPLRFAYATDRGHVRGRPMFDRSGNLWLATYYGGVERIAKPDPRGAASPAEASAQVERFKISDGLTSNATSAIFQDGENNVWIGTEKGLDGFWRSTVRDEPLLADPAAFGDILMRASDGTVYIAEAKAVYRVAPGGRPRAILRTAVEPSSLCEAPDGAVWITLDKEVVIWRAGRISRLSQGVPARTTIYDCAFDGAGAYWITAGRGGMFRHRDGRWQRIQPAGAWPFIPKTMIADASGRILVYSNRSTLSWVNGTSFRSLRLPFQSHDTDELVLYRGKTGAVFAAGRVGVARLKSGRLSSLRLPGGGLNGIRGVVEVGDDSWFALPTGLARMRTTDFEHAFDAADAFAIQHFGPPDGLRSRPHLHTRHALVRGGDDRIWVSTLTGTQWLDPREISRGQIPPKIAITAVIAERRYRDPTLLTLPAGTSNVEIDFAVINFASPRDMRVRYRIQGQDPAWIEAGQRRQAFFTNLAPGRYQFQVVAANQDGLWNSEGATVEFDIPPTFVQSRWFILLCGLFLLGAIWWIAALRTRQSNQRLRTRLEERLGERERIARDLHDTLLQSAQGLVLSFQAVAERVANRDREQLDTVLSRADAVIIEARDRLYALRRPAVSDLRALIQRAVDDIELARNARVSISVEGRTRPLHPFILSEISAILGEAFFNILRHASADKIEISARFTRKGLKLRVRDDGAGIPVDVMRGKLKGHFGLVGMRERAERVGGHLSIESQPGSGTDIILILPARAAFHRLGKKAFPGWRKRHPD